MRLMMGRIKCKDKKNKKEHASKANPLMARSLASLMRRALGDGSSMLGAPKKKYLGSVGPIEERGMATKSGASLT